MLSRVAARGALMIDLVENGAMTRDDSGTQVDTTATGSPLADDLLREVSEHPTRTMQRWLQRGTPHLDDFVEAMVNEGHWAMQRHGVIATHASYSDREHDRFAELRSTLTNVASGKAVAADGHQAALTIMCGSINVLLSKPRLALPSDQLLAACGELAWIVEDVATFVYEAQSQDLAAGTADAISSGFQIGSV